MTERISPGICNDKIKLVLAYNQNNQSSLAEWLEYIEWIKKYISNPTIAWDYMNNHIHNPNGTIFVDDFGCNITYSIKYGQINGNPYLCLFSFNFKLNDYNLKDPLSESASNLNIVRLTEHELHMMVLETLNIILSNKKLRV